MRGRVFTAALSLFGLACSGDETSAMRPGTTSASTTEDAGAPCAPGETPAGTTCVPAGDGAGIEPEHCAPGFVAEDRSCRPILPEAPCASGTFAVPGETRCH